MSDLPSTQATILAAAAVVASVGIIWRGVFRPLARAGGWIRDIAHDWAATVDLVRELVPLVAQLVVTTERRLTRLEAVFGVRMDPDVDQASTLLAHQLATRLRDATRHDERPR